MKNNRSTYNAVARAVQEQCAVCGKLLTGSYYMFTGRTERFCEHCYQTRPRCSNCGVPVGEKHWRLHDGRMQCSRCHSTAVYDPQFAQQLYDETVAAIVAQFGMSLHHTLTFRMVDKPTLWGVASREHSIEDRTQHGDPEHAPLRLLGLYQRRKQTRAMYILYGLPRLTFRSTVAHEYAHAWQAVYCPTLDDERLREGFAEWVAFYHLLWIDATKAARQMLETPHPYREAMNYLFTLEQQLGRQGVISYIKQAG
jgi:hypothetical protein